MTLVRMTAHFEAPIERVFELGTDIKRFPEWNVSHDAVTEITGPIDKVGTRIHSTMKMFGRRMEGWSEIVEVDRPRLLKLARSGPETSRLTLTYRMTPSGTGTDFALEAEYELPAALQVPTVDRAFMERTVERDMKHSLENFKAIVEAKVPMLV